MKRKFKHYATDEIREFEVKNSHAKIDEKWYKLEQHNVGIKLNGTSWVIYND